MNKPLKLIPIGSSTGVVLPEDVLARLQVDRGDSVFLTEGEDGAYRLTSSDPDFERKMAAAEQIMESDRDILHALSQ